MTPQCPVNPLLHRNDQGFLFVIYFLEANRMTMSICHEEHPTASWTGQTYYVSPDNVHAWIHDGAKITSQNPQARYMGEYGPLFAEVGQRRIECSMALCTPDVYHVYHHFALMRAMQQVEQVQANLQVVDRKLQTVMTWIYFPAFVMALFLIAMFMALTH